MSSVSQSWVPEAANNYQDSHTRACTRIVTLQLGAEAIVPSINSEDFFGPVAEPKRRSNRPHHDRTDYYAPYCPVPQIFLYLILKLMSVPQGELGSPNPVISSLPRVHID